MLIGAGIFILYYTLNPVSSNRQTILIDDDMIIRTGSLFQKQWGRPPSDSEWTGLLDQQIREEVYYREALKMNLDHNDEIIRRRMEQKLDFISSDLVQMKEPAEEELKAYYQKHKAKYLQQASYSFSHIYFNADKREHAKADAAKVLTSLPENDKNLAELTKLGDPFPFAYHTDGALQKEIDEQMGDDFAASLSTLPVGKWCAPILSGFGSHLIFIDSVTPASEAPFANIREQLLTDYRYDYQQQFNQKVYDDFKKEYTIELKLNKSKLDKQVATNLNMKYVQ